MKRYKCKKEVMAEPMDRVTAELQGLVRDKNTVVNGESEQGYKVVYKDGYQSWSPKVAFEEGYEEIE